MTLLRSTTTIVTVWLTLTHLANRCEAGPEDGRQRNVDKPWFGLLDYCIIAIVLFLTFIWWRSRSDRQCQTSPASATADEPSSSWSKYMVDKANDVAVDMPKNQPCGFIQKMVASKKSMVVFYGSQTGTAEEFAERIIVDGHSRGMRGIVCDPESNDMSDLPRIKSVVENSDQFKATGQKTLAVFVLATYGEGDPTDNAQEFHTWLKEDAVDGCLAGLEYAVFGLGNKTYENYNTMGIYVDNRLAELGGVRVFPIGLGDDDENLENDFIVWKDAFWNTVVDLYKLSGEQCASQTNLQMYSFTELAQDHKSTLYTGEPVRLRSYDNQKPLFDAKNPFLSQVLVNRNLHSADSERVCMHIELNIAGSMMRYDAGDHVAVCCQNDARLVQLIGDLLGLTADQLDTPFNAVANDVDSNKKTPFPVPTTYRTALTYYIDINSRPRTHILRTLASHCTDAKEAEFLTKMASVTAEGRQLYSSWIVDSCRNIVQLLQDLPSCRPPLTLIMSILPRLQPRLYSISSSDRQHPDRIHLTAVVIKYETPTGRTNHGVATSWLQKKRPSDFDSDDKGGKHDIDTHMLVPIYVRRGTFKLPIRYSTPVIMIGPGTGVAPFRGFVQERAWLKVANERDIGPTILFFGCRNRDKDFLYADEWDEFVKAGVLTLHTAFSRDGDEKEYVQHLMQKPEIAAQLWSLIDKQSAHLYVCGDAKNMSRDVHEAVVNIVKVHGNMESEKAAAYVKRMESRKQYLSDVWS